jgi:hypothetical protein
MSNLHLDWGHAIERIGLDWFIILAGKPAFNDPPNTHTLADLRNVFAQVKEDEALDDAIDYCSGLLKRENEREHQIESKAHTIIGFMGIATAFSLGFADLLIDRAQVASSWALVPIALLYVMVVLSFLWTIFLASKAVAVFEYRFTEPHPDDILALSRASLRYVKRERAASLFYSVSQNSRMVNRKGTYLGGAQLWFRNSIVVLLVLILVLAIFMLAAPITPQGTSAPGQPAIVPSQTLQPLATQTLAITRDTATALPTDMATAMPTATHVLSPTITATPVP